MKMLKEMGVTLLLAFVVLMLAVSTVLWLAGPWPTQEELDLQVKMSELSYRGRVYFHDKSRDDNFEYFDIMPIKENDESYRIDVRIWTDKERFPCLTQFFQLQWVQVAGGNDKGLYSASRRYTKFPTIKDQNEFLHYLEKEMHIKFSFSLT